MLLWQKKKLSVLDELFYVTLCQYFVAMLPVGTSLTMTVNQIQQTEYFVRLFNYEC